MNRPVILSALVILGFANAADAAVITYTATLSGAAESPPNASPGTGTSTVSYDDTAQTLRVVIDYSGLTTGATVAHIHCCTTNPGESTAIPATTVPSFPNFPTGTSGSYDQTFDLTQAGSWNPAFVTANGGATGTATTAFVSGLDTGRAYVNVHSSTYTGGEIRGFFQVVPVPAAAWLFATGLAGLALTWRAHRK